MSTLSLWTGRDPFAEFDALFRGAREPRGFVPAAHAGSDARRIPVSTGTPAIEQPAA